MVTSAQTNLPVRLRQRAVRHELPIPNKTTMLARPASRLAPELRQHDVVAHEPVVAVRAGSPPVAAPSINVEALTSHVIQQLDRRLLAYRERMGRV